MSYEVKVSKRYYHLQEEMVDWCNSVVGEGGWTYNTPKLWEGMGTKVWVIHCAFGNTTFAFKDEKFANWFALRWSQE